MTTNAQKIAAWRRGNPERTLTEGILLDILGLETLVSADLRSANLRRADLSYANLSYANLGSANLGSANLAGANGGVLSISGIPSGATRLKPTLHGWILDVGCETFGSTQQLRDLIAQDEDWPEATGDEIPQRRPILAAVADLMDAHIAAHPTLIDELAERWGKS